MKCINCNEETGSDTQIYCDDLCLQGFRNRVKKEFEEHFKRNLTYYD